MLGVARYRGVYISLSESSGAGLDRVPGPDDGRCGTWLLQTTGTWQPQYSVLRLRSP